MERTVPNIGGSKAVWFPPVIQCKFGNIAFDAEYPSFPSPLLPVPSPSSSLSPKAYTPLWILWKIRYFSHPNAYPLSLRILLKIQYLSHSPTASHPFRILFSNSIFFRIPEPACQPLGSSCDTLFASLLGCISSVASAQVCRLRATRAGGQNASLARGRTCRITAE